MTGVTILVIRDIRQVSSMAGRARLRLQMIVHNMGEAAQGPVWLRILRGALGHCVVIEGQFGDFSIPGYDKLDSGQDDGKSEACHLKKLSKTSLFWD